MSTLYLREEHGFQKASDREVLLKAQELIDEKFRSRPQFFNNTESLHLFLRVRLGGRDHEVFAVLFLDTHRRLIEYVELFRGTIDTAVVHIREVVKEALARNAASVILVHNHPHPCGVVKPSIEDEVVTLRLTAALAVVGVKVLDHLIVGESISSFVEMGLL